MNPDYDKQLEAEIGRELQALPELPAPATLAPRVMAALERPWYRQPWPVWPAAMRTASLAVLLVLFGGLCFAGWRWWPSESLTAASHRIGESLSEAGTIWNALATLAGALVLIVKQLGNGFIVLFLFTVACAYASCVGLGTVFVRYAFARR